MENKIPTAEEFIQQYAIWTVQDSPDTMTTVIDKADCLEAMIEYAKLHVKAALEAAADKATVTPIDHEEISEGSFRPIWGVDDDSILNAYPENLIV